MEKSVIALIFNVYNLKNWLDHYYKLLNWMIKKNFVSDFGYQRYKKLLLILIFKNEEKH